MATTVYSDERRDARTLARAQAQGAQAAAHLAGGRRLDAALDGAAATALSDRLARDARVAAQANRNASDALSAARVGDQALATLGDTLGRLAELATTAADATLAPEQRQASAAEFDQLRREIDRVANDTAFNGVHLLRAGDAVAAGIGEGSQEIVEFPAIDASADALGVAGASVATPDAARAALDAITGALDQVASARAGLGATESRIATGIRDKVLALGQIRSADQLIADADVAGEIATATAAHVRLQFGIALHAQANLDARQALRLLQP